MIAATATAGTLADARKALLDTALVTHPDLHQADLDKYMAIRGLEASEEVDPQRIRELAVALFLLSRQQSLTFDSMVRVAYHIFDEDGDGELDREEFQQLMKATLSTHLTLDFVLRLPAGKEAFLRHLKEEYAEENFYFWQSSEQFSSSLPTVAKAQTLYDGYAEWASNNREVMRSMTVAGERVAFITTLPRGRDIIDSSHLDGLYFKEKQQQQQQQHQQRQRQEEERVLPSYPSRKVGIFDYSSDSDDDDARAFVDKVEKPLPAHGDSKYSAEEIALRRFMTTMAWGPGLAVVKHNRGKGRGRRLLKFNDEESCLCWSGTFPPFSKTKVPAHKLLKASRAGCLVNMKMSDQGDVLFKCARLTDAIVLETGLNGLIRACNSSKELHY
eukprot:g15067.t1